MAWSFLICLTSGVLESAHSADVGVQPLAAAKPEVQRRGIVTLEEVIVIGRRGSARLPPQIELGGEEIDNLGAYDIGEAIARIGESLGFDAQPVIIVNGRQIVDARNFMGFPPDAMVRVEVLPQQAAAEYGEDPSRPVVNIVLQETFTSRDGYLKAARPTAGGTTSIEADARQSAIEGNDTRQFGVRLSRETALRAEERSSYLEQHPDSFGVSLRPHSDALQANAAMTFELGDWASSLGADVRAGEDRFTSLLEGQAVETRRRAEIVGLSAGASGTILGWTTRFGVQGNASRAVQTGLSDFRSDSRSIRTDLSLNRSLIELPAGPLRAALSSQYARLRSNNESQAGDFRRSNQTLDLRGTLNIPVSQRGPDDGSWGDAALSLGATATGVLDDAGQGEGLIANFSWSPRQRLNLSFLVGRSASSPAGPMRFDPVYYGSSRTVFDFQTGETAQVLPLLGGNPDLRSQNSDQISVSASVGPLTSRGVQGRIGFQRNRSSDGFGVIPDVSPAMEAAFPDRFIRDETGRLIVIDQRPLNFASTLTETLTTGLNFNLPGGENGSWQIGVNHAWRLTDLALLREGVPELDRLAGDGGGAPRHQVSLQLNGRYGGLGVNAAARWQNEARLRREAGHDGPDDIVRASFAAIDVKLTYLFEGTEPPPEENATARRRAGVRFELEMVNLFDERPRASRGDGRPASGYGRDEQDPMGRIIRLTLSRRF